MKNLIYICLITAALLACNGTENKEAMNNSAVLPAPLMPSNKLNVAFLIVDGVYNSELIAPMDILHHTVFHTEKGMSVFTVAPDSTIITSFEGLKIIPDYAFLYDSLPPIHVLVVPSAEHSMGSDLENEALINFVKTTGNNAKYVMSLCDGAFVLAQAGLVNEKESTTFPSDIQRYKETFPQLTVHDGVSFVHDGKLITSVGGAKSYDPALYLSEILYGKKAAKGIAKGLVIDWNVEEIEFVRVQ